MQWRQGAVRKAKSLALVALLGTSGCTQDEETRERELGGTDDALSWQANDAPSIFGRDLLYKLEELPREGSAFVTPWAGSYWATYEDSINAKWAGSDTLSPAGKYGQAFGIEGVEDAVSRYHGIDSQSHRTACSDQSACDRTKTESCAKRAGMTMGFCVPTWFGICHAWAPAAILYEEPRAPVTRNGVTFQVNDIKALLSLALDRGVETRFTSGRCNEDEQSDGIEYDEYGRPKLGQCLDTNAATFHILLANYLGMRGETFVEDRTFDDQVWNQPIRAFEVTKLEEISAQRANELVGVPLEGGERTELSATVAPQTFTHFGPYTVATGAHLRVEMTGEGDADLYVRRGAEPDAQNYDCRPYSARSEETCDLVAAGETSEQIFVSVRGFSAETAVQLSVLNGASVPTTYRFNGAATRFFDVALQVDYITESPAEEDGPLNASIDRYTRTDRYTYVLELDAEGKLLGGEWTGPSKRNHVDFLWLPVGTSDHVIAGGKIRFGDVLSLYYASMAQEGTVRVVKPVRVARSQWRTFGPFPANTALKAELSGSGDADLYVRRSGVPSDRRFDCRPFKHGSSETCELAGAGSYYVAVRGYADDSDVQLTVTFAP